MIINPYAIPIWIAVIFITSLSVVIFWGSHRLSSRIFALAIFVAAMAAASVAYFLYNTDFGIESFGTRLTMTISLFATFGLALFAISFKEERLSFGSTFLGVIVYGAAGYLIFFTDLIVAQPIKAISSTGVKFGWQAGPYGFIAILLIFIAYAVYLYVFIKKYRSTTDVDLRRHILFLIFSLFIGGGANMICNNYLPFLGNFDYAWLGPTTGVIWASMMAYSIARHHQMNVRVVATEVIMIAMSVIAFINIFFSDSFGMGGRIIIFVAFIILGIFLIRGSLREAEQSEQLRDLNANLQKKVEEQTSEIKKSYEIERASRLELEKVDQAKNQFIMITQHHLRTPITSIKWQLESIMNGTYGQASTELKKAMSDMGESVERLNHLINSLLSISALKAGIETLTKTPTDMNKMVEQIIQELHKEIDRRHINVEVSSLHQPWPFVPLDAKRMEEVLFIIIENAVRYNIDNGSINISGQANESKFELTVENTGIELSPEEKAKMFSELFYRSSQAQIVHPTGMGIGLTMAQAIIEAHHGSISINPRKTGGGVKVIITLPY